MSAENLYVGKCEHGHVWAASWGAAGTKDWLSPDRIIVRIETAQPPAFVGGDCSQCPPRCDQCGMVHHGNCKPADVKFHAKYLARSADNINVENQAAKGEREEA